MSGERLKWLRISGGLIALAGIGIAFAARYFAGTPDVPLTRTEMEYGGIAVAIVGVVMIYLQQRVASSAPGDGFQKQVAQSQRRFAAFLASPHFKWAVVVGIGLAVVVVGVAMWFYDPDLSRLARRRFAAPILFGVVLAVFLSAWFLHGRSRSRGE